jgi:hypothetical protein
LAWIIFPKATLTEALRLEQQNTETLITQINTGKIFKIIK